MVWRLLNMRMDPLDDLIAQESSVQIDGHDGQFCYIVARNQRSPINT